MAVGHWRGECTAAQRLCTGDDAAEVARVCWHRLCDGKKCKGVRGGLKRRPEIWARGMVGGAGDHGGDPACGR